MESTQPINPRQTSAPSQASNLYGENPDAASGKLPLDEKQPNPLNRDSISQMIAPPYPPQPLTPELAKLLTAEIRDRKIEILTHFTRLENLASILTHGLLPRNLLLSEGRTRFVRFNQPNLPGYWENSLSFNISFPNYRLFYNLQEQMGYEWVVLVLDINLILSQPFYYFLYPAANLIQTPVFASEISPWLQTIDAFKTLFQDTDNVRRAFLQIPDSYPTHPQSEILTFQPIPPAAIMEVHFYNNYKFNQWFLQNTPLAMTFDKKLWHESLEFFSPRCDYPHWKSTYR